MRCLQRNKQEFYYSVFRENRKVTNEFNQVVDYKPVYDSPVKSSANISAARGQSGTEPFGLADDYDRVIVADSGIPILKESDLIWIDAKPPQPHDYVIVRVAKSLNSVSYAIRRVDLSE